MPRRPRFGHTGSMGQGTRRRTGSWLGTTVVVVLLAALGYVALTAAQVWWSARTDSPAEADAIIVLGAAQYDGRPSAALQGRLDHAARLYEEGQAPRIIVTGGSREGDRFTEAEAGALYLHTQGVPGEAIERETTGASTYASLASVARYLQPEGVTSVIVVSDPFHNHRAMAIAEEVGFEASASASTTSPFRGSAGLAQWARETTAVALGRLLGYRRLEAIGLRLDELDARIGTATITSPVGTAPARPGGTAPHPDPRLATAPPPRDAVPALLSAAPHGTGGSRDLAGWDLVPPSRSSAPHRHEAGA